MEQSKTGRLLQFSALLAAGSVCGGYLFEVGYLGSFDIRAIGWFSAADFVLAIPASVLLVAVIAACVFIAPGTWVMLLGLVEEILSPGSLVESKKFDERTRKPWASLAVLLLAFGLIVGAAFWNKYHSATAQNQFLSLCVGSIGICLFQFGMLCAFLQILSEHSFYDGTKFKGYLLSIGTAALGFFSLSLMGLVYGEYQKTFVASPNIFVQLTDGTVVSGLLVQRVSSGYLIWKARGGDLLFVESQAAAIACRVEADCTRGTKTAP